MGGGWSNPERKRPHNQETTTMLGSRSLHGLIASRAGLLMVWVVTSVLAGAACKSADEGSPPARTDAKTNTVGDAAAAGDVLGSTADALTAADAMAPSLTCAENETCAFLCTDEAACKQHCSATLVGQEKTLLDAVVACLQQQCPDKNDNLCRCEAECYEDGPCAGALDACTGGLADPWCDKFCH
jgi:hypothetical protein